MAESPPTDPRVGASAPAVGDGGIPPTRVTHVVFDLNAGGFESLIATMARRFAGTDVRLSAISLSGRPGRVGTAITPLLSRYEWARQSRGLSMVLPLGLAQAIRRSGADVVHLHSGSWYKGSLAARLAGVAGVVYTEHGREHHDPFVARWLDRQASRRTDVVVAVSDRLARYLERTVGVLPDRVRVIGNGVDTAAFCPGDPSAEARRRLGIPSDALVVGSIGRLESVKAYERLIDAVAHLRERAATSLGRPVVGVIWGDGAERASLEARVAQRGLADAFRLPGWTDDAAESHRLLDVFLLTSRSEGASVSLMESLATGVAPVVMDVGANAEVVGPELTAQVVPAGDETALASTLDETLRDPERRRRAGELGRRRMIARYSVDAMIDAYARLYHDLARARRVGS